MESSGDDGWGLSDMKCYCEKLKGQAGESITEILIALLISSFALIMLAGMITASSRSITSSSEAIESYYAGEDPKTGDISITIAGQGESYVYSASDTKQELANHPIDSYHIS